MPTPLVIAFALGMLVMCWLSILSAVAGEHAERNYRIRRASFRSRRSQWVEL